MALSIRAALVTHTQAAIVGQLSFLVLGHDADGLQLGVAHRLVDLALDFGLFLGTMRSNSAWASMVRWP